MGWCLTPGIFFNVAKGLQRYGDKWFERSKEKQTGHLLLEVQACVAPRRGQQPPFDSDMGKCVPTGEPKKEVKETWRNKLCGEKCGHWDRSHFLLDAAEESRCDRDKGIVYTSVACTKQDWIFHERGKLCFPIIPSFLNVFYSHSSGLENIMSVKVSMYDLSLTLGRCFRTGCLGTSLAPGCLGINRLNLIIPQIA